MRTYIVRYVRTHDLPLWHEYWDGAEPSPRSIEATAMQKLPTKSRGIISDVMPLRRNSKGGATAHAAGPLRAVYKPYENVQRLATRMVPANCSVFPRTDPAFEPGLRQHQSPPSGNAILPPETKVLKHRLSEYDTSPVRGISQ